MKQRIIKYGFSLWLAFCLLSGLSPWSSAAMAQGGYPDKVLETVKKKKQKKRKKKNPKPKENRGTDVMEIQPPLMDLRKPGSRGKRKLPKKDKFYQPELNDNRSLRLKQKKEERQRTIFSGRLKEDRNEGPAPGTHYKGRIKRQEIDNNQQGTRHAGSIRVKPSEISEPGKGQEHSRKEFRKHQQRNGTGFAGRGSVPKKQVREPGVHHQDRPGSLSKKWGNSTEAASHAGHMRVRKDEMNEPGTLHSDRKESVGRKYSSYEGSRHSGDHKIAKKYVKKPGTHYSERKKSMAGQYESTVGTNYAGTERVKKKYLKEPGTLHSDRKRSLARQYSSTRATGFRGHIKVLSRRQESRFYEELSYEMHQYEGSIKIKSRHRNMHPSAAARKNVVMRSREMAERRRGLHRWWNKLWDRGQPEVVKEEAKKPRYDGDEGEIWDKSREW
ncbi:hypothetical protein [Nafulsella turpanensis]|uniref:hypothetical protein n=1 Tax=Nafulsella turpanensis TaxID=1265690 RepID=UPI00034707E4|nr:hypothetical protein [Nafulsella turpanensis]